MGATVGDTFQAGAGTVLIDGRIDGDAVIGADTIRLGETASIGGSLRYDGTLEGNRGPVEGDVIHDPSLSLDLQPALEQLTSWLFTVYSFILNLLLGSIHLALFPRFSQGVADRITSTPLRTAGVGLGLLVAIPLLLIALAVTIVGIPITVAGAVLFAIVAWVALVYGRFAVGAWLLSFVGYQNRWLALVLGLVATTLLGLIPILEALLNFPIFLLGFGALARGLYAHRCRVGAERESASAEETASN